MSRKKTTLALLAALAAALASSSAGAYLSPEHRQIGDAGARTPLQKLFQVAPLPWKDIKGRVLVDTRGRVLAGGGQGAFATLGELIAIYGDWRATEAALASTPANELAALQKYVHTGKLSAGLLWNEGWNAAGLATENQSHFSSIAAATYFDTHARALEHAAAAGETGDRARLWSALHAEAVALHSLTDLFAPGHLFVDRREQVRKLLEGRQGIYGVFRNPLRALTGLKKFAEGLWGGRDAKKLHDQMNKAGVELRNGLGEAWRGFGDGNHKRQTKAASAVVERAVADSIESLRRIYVLARTRAKEKVGDRPLAVLARSGAYHNALLRVPTHFRKARFADSTLCNQAAYCAFLLDTTVSLLLAGKRTEAERSADAEAARMASLAQPLDPDKADTKLRPGDIMLLRAEGRPSIIQRAIQKGQRALKWLFGGKSNKGLQRGATTVTHAMIYLGKGLIADAAEKGVHVRPLAAVGGEVVSEVYRPKDITLGQRAAEIALKWANGRMKYKLPLLVPFGNSVFGSAATSEALRYALAANTSGGPPEFTGMFCTQFVLGAYQAAVLERALKKEPRLNASQVRLEAPFDRHASRLSATTMQGKLGSATRAGTWQVVGWFETGRAN